MGRISTNYYPKKRRTILKINGDDGSLISGDLKGLTITNPSAGIYNITSTIWGDFGIVLTPRTSDNNNTFDQRKVSWKEIINGYELIITLDDNGETADPRVDEHFIVIAEEF